MIVNFVQTEYVRVCPGLLRVSVWGGGGRVGFSECSVSLVSPDLNWT